MSVEQYTTAVYNLVELRDYGTLKDEMLLDHIVVGITDASLSLHLQMDSNVMLETAKKAAIEWEAIFEQERQLRGDSIKQALL